MSASSWRSPMSGKRVMLEENEVSRGLVGKYVDIYAFADGRLDIRWKGITLPYKIFDKDQRVTHAAVTENKRLGDVLSFIKAQQDQMPPPKSEDQQRSYRLSKTRSQTARPKGLGRSDGRAASAAEQAC